MRVLGIEGTAHTISSGIVDENSVLSNVNSVYVPQRGGIHPREAAVHHASEVSGVIKRSIQDAQIDIRDIDLVAFSSGPGLGPCLRIAATAARTLAIKFDKPIVRVNHPLGHIEIGRKITGAKDPVMLYVSGGNTQVIAHVNGRYRVMGETIDIGVGNMLDKLARDFDIPFPGGPVIEKIAREGNNLLDLPYSVKGMNCSFSGIYTAALAYKRAGKSIGDIFYSVQETSFSVLVEILERALYLTGKKEIMVAGGVARNDRLREMIMAMAVESGYEAKLTDKQYCMDNGAMIAQAGMLLFGYNGGEKIENTRVNQRERIDSVDAPWIRSGKVSPKTGIGAESLTEKIDYYGRKAVLKRRIRKSYRNPQLDNRIRITRQRTEFIILKRLGEIGINSPVLYDYDPFNSSITMQSISGDTLSRYLSKERNADMAVSRVGKVIAKMHASGITHGDLTTNNIMIDGESVYLIDPSMGKIGSNIEDMAADLFLILESFKSMSSETPDLTRIFLDSYTSSLEVSKSVLDTLNLMESRRRYV